MYISGGKGTSAYLNKYMLNITQYQSSTTRNKTLHHITSYHKSDGCSTRIIKYC